MSIGLRTLVLNNNFTPVSLFPLYTIPAEDAISRVLNHSCTCVLEYERPILTPSREDLFWPSVIVNHNSFSYRNEIRLKKETLFYRDHGLCIYCEEPLTLSTITYDHVIPQSKGGKHAWENVGAACPTCNALKGNADPKGKWSPSKKPKKPTYFELFEIRRKFPIVVDDERWLDFLGEWEGKVVVRSKHHGHHPKILGNG